MYLAAVDWTTLTTGLSAAFEDGVEQALPIAGVILAAFRLQGDPSFRQGVAPWRSWLAFSPSRGRAIGSAFSSCRPRGGGVHRSDHGASEH